MAEWGHLPDELLLYLFKCVAKTTLIPLGQVCRSWRRVARDKQFWNKWTSYTEQIRHTEYKIRTIESYKIETYFRTPINRMVRRLHIIDRTLDEDSYKVIGNLPNLKVLNVKCPEGSYWNHITQKLEYLVIYSRDFADDENPMLLNVKGSINRFHMEADSDLFIMYDKHIIKKKGRGKNIDKDIFGLQRKEAAACHRFHIPWSKIPKRFSLFYKSTGKLCSQYEFHRFMESDLAITCFVNNFIEHGCKMDYRISTFSFKK